MIAKVAIPRPVKDPFDYRIPQKFIPKIKKGKRVRVNFRGSEILGYVVDIAKKSRIKELRTIQDVIDEEPIFDNHLLRLTKKVSQYYLSSWGEVLDAAFPLGLKKSKIKIERKRIDKKIDKEEIINSKLDNSGYNKIRKIISDRIFKVYLYHARNQEDKIALYLKLIKEAFRIKKSVLLLAAEILSVDILVSRIKRFYPDDIAIYHSQLKTNQKKDNLAQIISKKARIVIGSRSAVFSPLAEIGVIIIDEEESDLYKKPDAPRFNTKKVAELRAKMLKCPLILSSITPSIESYYMAKRRVFSLIREKGEEKYSLEKVEIIDLKREKDIYRRKGLLSYRLKDAIDNSLKEDKNVILFLNRRGFATFIRCRECGYIIKCPRCKKNLTYHYDRKELICHYCNYRKKPPKICPQCKKSYINYSGFGTEKLESILCHRYPQSKVKRLDADVASQKGKRYKILSDFNKGKIDILIGTQILFKGISFRKTGLIGIINADTAMHLPDFRMQEKVFATLYNIINQVRQENKDTKVIIQTFLPSHFAIKQACELNYIEFYKNELKQRKALNLPPYYHFNCIILKGKVRKKIIEKARELFEILKKNEKGYKEIKIIQPQPSIISKIRGNYRLNIIIRCKDLTVFKKIINKSLRRFRRPSGLLITVDIDAREEL